MLFSMFVFVLGFIAGCVCTWILLKRDEATSTISAIPTPWPAKSSFDEVYRWHQNTKTTLKRLQDKISKQETQLQQLTLSNNEFSERMANLQAAFAAPPPTYHQPRLVPLSDIRTDQSILSLDQSPDLSSSFDGIDEQPTLLRAPKLSASGTARRRSSSTGPEAPLQHASLFVPTHTRSPSDPTDPLTTVVEDDTAKAVEDASLRPPTIKGWLQIKRVKLWHNYYFALRDSWLSCYRNENMEESLGHINVRGCCIRPRIEKTEFEVYHPKKQPIFKQTPNNWSIGPFGYGMQLMSEGSYTGKLRAPNLDMTRQWMTAISHACQMLEAVTAPRELASAARKQPSEGPDRVRFEPLSSFSELPDATPSLSSSLGVNGSSITSQSTPALLGYTATTSSSAPPATPAPSASAASGLSASVASTSASGTPPSSNASSEGSLVEIEPPYQWQRTQEEKEALENIIYELQETNEYDSEILDECTLIRFLRARNMDIERASLMLREFLKWRNTFKPHLITVDDVKDAVMSHMVHLHGFDKKGHPAIIIHAQRHDAVNRDVDVMVRFIVFVAQTAVQVMRPPIEKFAIIFDYTGFSSKKNGDWPVSKEAIHILQNYFPERLGYVFLVNYPMMLSALWRMIKPLLDPKTAAKIQFVDLPVLKEYFDESNLLPEHGGTSTYQPTGLSIGLETCTRR